MIVTSPLLRARQTAEAVAKATGAPLEVEDDLAETDFGKWEGMTFAEIQARWPDELAAWLASVDVAPPGGESFAAVTRRVVAALDRLLAAHALKTLVSGESRYADQDAGLPGDTRAPRGHVPDPPGCRVAVRDRLVLRRPGRRQVAERHGTSALTAYP